MKVLVIEDDERIREYLRTGFVEEAFTVDVAKDGLSGLQLIESTVYEFIILDLMLPGVDGFSLLKKIRSMHINTPLLILSAQQSVEDKIRGLDIGADDYIVKPFSFAEVMARINAILRRKTEKFEDKILTFKGWKLDRYSRKLFFEDKFVDLKAKEFALMELFMRNRERVLSKSFILDRIWNIDFDPQTNVVDVLVCRLRSQLESIHSQRVIFTIRGAGYVFR